MIDGYLIERKDINRILIKRSLNNTKSWLAYKRQELARYGQKGLILATMIKTEEIIMNKSFGEDITDEVLGEIKNISKYTNPITTESQATPPNITFHIGGDAKINQNSIDNSINISSSTQNLMEIIKAIRDEVQRADIKDSQKSDAIEITNSIEVQIRQEKKSLPVINALIAALPALPTIGALAQSLLSMLTK